MSDRSANEHCGDTQFLVRMYGQTIGRDDFEITLAYNMIVHPLVRAFLLQRDTGISGAHSSSSGHPWPLGHRRAARNDRAHP